MNDLYKQFENDPKKAIRFYFSAILFWVFVLYSLSQESYEIWSDGEVATGIIRDKSIPCSDPKIEIMNVLYIIDNCDEYPEGKELPVISIPSLDYQIWVGKKGDSVAAFVWQRGKWLYIFWSVAIVGLISLLTMYLKRHLREKS